MKKTTIEILTSCLLPLWIFYRDCKWDRPIFIVLHMVLMFGLSLFVIKTQEEFFSVIYEKLKGKLADKKRSQITVKRHRFVVLDATEETYDSLHCREEYNFLV